jgi:hypothetical protein
MYFIAAGAVAVQLATATTSSNSNSGDTTDAAAVDDETAALHSAPPAVVTLARAKSEALGEVSFLLHFLQLQFSQLHFLHLQCFRVWDFAWTQCVDAVFASHIMQDSHSMHT